MTKLAILGVQKFLIKKLFHYKNLRIYSFFWAKTSFSIISIDILKYENHASKGKKVYILHTAKLHS